MNSTSILFHAIIFFAGLLAPQFIHGQTKDENFSLLDDFEKNKSSFKRDTFSLPEISNDGGQVIEYKSPDKNYNVFALQLFGQPGKLHYLFITDKDSNLKLTKQLEYEYHKPGDKNNYEAVRKITFYSFHNKSFKVYNAERAPTKDEESDKRKKIEKLFEQVKEK